MPGRLLLGVMLTSVSILFAGCAGSSAAGPAGADGPQSVVEIQGDGTTGGGIIEGLVVDDSVEPLAHATVGLTELNLQATSDAAGAFAFKGVAPGTYTLVGIALGYESAGRSVEVVEGEVARVTLTLSAIRVDETYIDIVPFKLFMACGYGLIGVTVTTAGALCPEQVFGRAQATEDVNASKNIVSARAEMRWTQTSGFSAKEMRLDMGINETGGSTPRFEERYDSKTGPSPLLLSADEPFKGITDGEEETYEIRYRIWVPFQSPDPPFVMLVIQQPLDVYSAFFYGEPAPEGYSPFPDE